MNARLSLRLPMPAHSTAPAPMHSRADGDARRRMRSSATCAVSARCGEVAEMFEMRGVARKEVCVVVADLRHGLFCIHPTKEMSTD